MDTLILVATMTGTAEMVAEDIQAAIGAERAEMVVAEQAEVGQLQRYQTLLVVSSTYGEGEVPEPAKAMFAAIEAAENLPSGLRFAVLGLGDRSLYAATFAQGGQRWDTMLAAKGLVRASAPLLIDCSGTQTVAEEGVAWVNGWLDAAGQASPAEVH